jgi:hypothetical protein
MEVGTVPETRKVWILFGVAVAAIVVASTSAATGTAGAPVLLGRHNCSGSVDDTTCSGGQRTTSIDWDRNAGAIPANAGLAIQGDPAVIGATNPQYAFDSEWITGVAGFGSDRGGFFYGVNAGVVGDSEDVGVEGSSPAIGVRADGGDIGLVTTGDVALSAEGAVAFSSAGVAEILSGRASTRVTPGVPIGFDTKVLATVQSRGGTLRRVALDTSGTDAFTIWLTAPARQRVTVAYFVIG